MNRWWMPYAVLVLIPAATLMLAGLVMRGADTCHTNGTGYEFEAVQLALLPTLLDLLPFAWLLSARPEVRVAALVAGCIGLVRFAIPEAWLLAEGRDEQRGLNDDSCTGYPVDLFLVLGMTFAMPVLWGASAVLAGIAAWTTLRVSPKAQEQRSR